MKILLTPLTLLLPMTTLSAQGAADLGVAVDHLILSTGNLGLGAEEFARRTGVTPRFGGQHPGRGTQNSLVSLGPGLYIELLAPVLDNADTAAARPRPSGWALRTTDLDGVIRRVQAAGIPISAPVPGSRLTPDGTLLKWRTAGVSGPGLELAPFFIEWDRATAHPSTTAPGGCELRSFELVAPDPARLLALFAAVGLRHVVREGPDAHFRITLACSGRETRFEP